MEITLWGSQAENFPYREGDKLEILNIEIGEFGGLPQLRVMSSTVIRKMKEEDTT